MAVPDIYEVTKKIRLYEDRLRNSLIKKVEFMKMRYEKCMSSSAIKEPTRKINENYIKLDGYIKQLENIIKIKNEKERTKYVELVAKLDAFSPLKTLTRGYSITEKNGNIIKTSKELNKGDIVSIKFIDGNKEATIN